MKKIFQLLMFVVIGAVSVIGGRWYTYVTNTSSPYDEVGIELNSRLPEPLRAWGCGKLRANFPRSLPPYGCAKPGTQRDWL